MIGKHKTEDLTELTVASCIRSTIERGVRAGANSPILEFFIEKKSAEALQEEKAKFQALAAQPDLFNSKPLIP